MSEDYSRDPDPTRDRLLRLTRRVEALEQRDDLTGKTLEGHNLRLERLEDVLLDEPERLPVAMRVSLLEGTVSGLIAGLRENADGYQCACGDAHVDTCQGCAADPAPVPEWRRLVDKEAEKSRYWHEHEKPLSVVLYHLSELAALHLDVDELIDAPRALARIVAVCEVQVGDGWQADPSGWPNGSATVELLVLNTVLPENGKAYINWRGLANAAAAWLRDLTEDAS